MNFLFLTQSQTLSAFYDLSQMLMASNDADNIGFYISDSVFYRKYTKTNPEIASGKYQLLKEWDIISRSYNTHPDYNQLAEYEKKYGDPVLWNALVADRRIYLGKKATFEQDYASRFNYEQMLAILQVAIQELESLFDRVQPDAVISFICVTIGEYLAYRIAQTRNIPFIDLRPTRIQNFFYAGESVHEPSAKLEEAYYRMLNQGIPDALQQQTRAFLSELRQTHAMYEGVLPVDSKLLGNARDRISRDRRLSGVLLKCIDLIQQFFIYTLGIGRHDNSYRGTLYPHWFKRVKQPLRARWTDIRLKKHYADSDELSKLKFAFFPLHKEQPPASSN